MHLETLAFARILGM